MGDFIDAQTEETLAPDVQLRCLEDNYHHNRNLPPSWCELYTRRFACKFRSKNTVGRLGPEKLTGWGNAAGVLAFEQFLSSGKNINLAVNEVGAEGNCSSSNTIYIVSGVTYKIVVNVTLNSGTLPEFYVNPLAPIQLSIAQGLNEIYWVATETTDATLLTFHLDTAATSFSAICSMKQVY